MVLNLINGGNSNLKEGGFLEAWFVKLDVLGKLKQGNAPKRKFLCFPFCIISSVRKWISQMAALK